MLPDEKSTNRLPVEFQKYFWDIHFEELTFEEYPRLVAERLLNYGDLDSIKWLLSRADREFIRSVVKSSRNLNAKTRNYWELILADH